MKDNMRFNYLPLLLGLLVLVASCQDKDVLTQSAIQDGNNVLSIGDKTILPTGESFIAVFTSDAPWTVDGCPDWIRISRSSGRSGTTSIRISADCNDTRKDRIATLRFVAKDGSFSTPMTVTQPYPYLRINIDSLSFNWNDCRTEREGVIIDNNPQKVSISSNVAWRIEEISKTKGTVDFTHFTLSSSVGKDDYDLNVIPIRDNYNKVPYDVQFRLYPVVRDAEGNETEISAAAADSYVLKFHQKNLRFLINDSVDDAKVEFTELNDNPNINLSVDCELKWDVSSCPEWVVMSKKTGQGVVSVNFKADGANPACVTREGVVRLSTSAGAYREIKVSQNPYVFDISETNLRIGNEDFNEYKFNVSTTGTWKITNIPSWITVTPEECTQTTPISGKDLHEITVKSVGQNLNFDDLSQIIKVSSTLNALSQEVTVKQDKFVFDVDYATILSNLPTMNTAKHAVTIESSGRWEILDIPEWVDVSQLSSEIKGMIDFTIGAKNGNPDLDNDRLATLKVVSLNHKDAGQDVVRQIPIKQRKYTFELVPHKDVAIPAYKNKFDNYSLTVQCSADWTLSECPDWITPSDVSGDGTADVEINLIPSINTQKISRGGVVKIISHYNTQEKSITVTQDAFVFDDGAEAFDDVVVMNKKSYPVSFDLTSEAGWKLVECDPWLNPSDTSGVGTSGRAELMFTPSPNPELTERHGSAIIESVVTGESKTVSFTQEKYVFDSEGESFGYTELDKKTNTINVVSSGPWMITDLPPWMYVSSANGETSSEITIHPEKNTYLSSREGTFYVVSTLNQLKKPVFVMQEGFLFDSSSLSYSYATLEERTDKFDVLSSGKWIAKDVPTWISISKKAGNGDESGAVESVSISSTENLTESDRNATIRIVSEDDASHVKEISINQAKFDFRVDKTHLVYSGPLDTHTEIINVTCPASWTIKSNQDWVSASILDVEPNGNVAIAPQRNLTTSDRTAEITITSVRNGLERVVTLTQPKFVFAVDKSTHTFASPLASENAGLTVNVECSDEWEVATESSWLKLSATGAKGDGKFNVTADSNLNQSDRVGKVIVKSLLNGLTKEIEITQKKYEFDLTLSNVTFEACPASSQFVSVICSGEWMASGNVPWVALKQSTSKGNGKVTLTVENNPSESQREALITIASKDNPTLVKTVCLIQKGHTLVLGKAEVAFTAAPTSDSVVAVETVGPWSATSNADWCIVSQNNQSGNGQLTIAVSTNTSMQERKTTVTIACDKTDLKKSIVVKQSKYEFDQTSVDLNVDATSPESKVVKVTSSGKWSASSNVEWVKVTQDVTSGNGNLTIKIESNPTQDIRVAVVTIECSDNSSWKKLVNITQEAQSELINL